MPVAVVAALASVRVWAYCMTEILHGGHHVGWGAAPGRIVGGRTGQQGAHRRRGSWPASTCASQLRDDELARGGHRRP